MVLVFAAIALLLLIAVSGSKLRLKGKILK